MPLDVSAFFDSDISVLTPGELIFNPRIEQVAGVGSGGSTYQARMTVNITGITEGTFYARFRSGHNAGVDGKTVVASFPIVIPRDSFPPEATEISFTSAANLNADTDYWGLVYWVSDSYAGTHAAGASGEVYPVGEALVETAPLTISGITPIPTDISPNSLSIQEQSAAGTGIGTIAANVAGATYSQQTGQEIAWIDVDSATGAVSVAAGQVAPTGAQSVTLKARATTAGGSYDEDITINVTAIPTGGGGNILETQLPAKQAGVPVSATITALLANLTALSNDWPGTMTSWGLNPATDRPILPLAQGNHGDLAVTGYDFSAHLGQEPLIRGEGGFSRDAYAPTCGTKVGRLLFTNCHSIGVVGVEAASGTSAHIFSGLQNFILGRNVIYDQVARSTADLATQAPGFNPIQFANCTNVEVIGNAFMGGRNGTVRFINTVCSGFIFDLNVWGQGTEDNINLGGGTYTNFIIRRNLFGGRARDSRGKHRDAIQAFGNGGSILCDGWLVEENIHHMCEWYGSDTHASMQFLRGGSGSNFTNAIIRFNLVVNTSRLVAEAGAFSSGNNSCTDNVQIMMQGPTASQTGGSFAYSASYGGCESVQTVARNWIMAKSNNPNKGEGPGGIVLFVPLGSNSDDPNNDWAEADALFFAPVRRGTAASPAYLPQILPRAGLNEGLHWDDTNAATGTVMLKKLFVAADQDHVKLRNFPIDAMAHIEQDPNNGLVGTSGTYSTYTDDGVNTG